MIELSTVRFSYDRSEHFVLNDVSFHVDKGEFLVLSGPTGTGKSTIVKLLNRQLSANSGFVRVNGTDLKTLSRGAVAKYRRTIGCVLQDLHLLEDRTIEENLAFAIDVQGNPTKNKRDLIALTLERVGVHCDLRDLPRSLSLGERQRVSIARALVNEPLLLIADNPTSQLDEETAMNILKIFTNEHFRGMTIFLTTSLRTPIASLGDDVRYLSIDEHGSVREG